MASVKMYAWICLTCFHGNPTPLKLSNISTKLIEGHSSVRPYEILASEVSLYS